ncbi:composite domain of metallo-dependent hydrolase [Paxillus ammoniavirescens]|nr:composite domain of metallo-dependent hydrolase [Paxillus ammoniavirescens]
MSKELDKPRWRRPTPFFLQNLWPLSKLLAVAFLSLILLSLCRLRLTQNNFSPNSLHSERLAKVAARCEYLAQEPGPPPDFHQRTHSDRFDPGTPPTLIRSAKIWTGNNNGSQVIHGDILLENGLIVAIGRIHKSVIEKYKHLEVVDVHGAWVTPGIVDLHSHIGVDSIPELRGSDDYYSPKAAVAPWARSLDGLNTHDLSYELSTAGGVTTAIVLPGSAGVIGGQAFPIKLRKTEERTTTSMLLEPPSNINTSFPNSSISPRWRHLKQACGENPVSVFGMTRMDVTWALREAYNKARQLKESQDDYCSKITSGTHSDLGSFPEDLEWEMLTDVLRGKVKVHTHCYEAVDLDQLMRLSEEFQFPIASVHHASEAYLVPEVLKRNYGPPPAIAMFGSQARYKREAYRGSEFAPRILAEHGFDIVMKSDHPVLNSRYLLFEAQQAYYYGLSESFAIASVTSTPARVLGLDHRVGYLRPGWDADLVVWDSHPLAIGATPIHVFIDGISQLPSARVALKPSTHQKVPKVPNFDKEAKAVLQYDGLPPLQPSKKVGGRVLFANVTTLFSRDGDDITEMSFDDTTRRGVVLVENGAIQCVGTEQSCAVPSQHGLEIVDLKGGSISPGLVSFGAPLGTAEILSEDSTNDGNVLDPFTSPFPSILGSDRTLIRAVDGLQFGGRDALTAYRCGVTSAITAPSSTGFVAGLSTRFSLGADHALKQGAIINEIAGLHVALSHAVTVPSISTQIAVLRRLLLHPTGAPHTDYFTEVTKGHIPIVIEAHSADIIATLIRLKKEVENTTGRPMKMTITGASEAHLLAHELSYADVGVILNPARPFPLSWEAKRILPGPPLTQETAISRLVEHGVTVGIGIIESWDARNSRFDLTWAALEAGGKLSRKQAIKLASTNLEKLLTGSVPSAEMSDLIALEGGDIFDLESKVVAIVSPLQRSVDLL